MTTLSDDELTELECAILDACEEKRREGWGIMYGDTVDSVARKCCPLYALLGDSVLQHGPAELPGFVNGFDRTSYYSSASARPEFVAMGRRFRERLDRGDL